MRLALALGELSAALPLSSLAFSPSCAIGCSTSKESCNATTAIAITNPRPNNRSMRCFIYVLVFPEQDDSWYRECLTRREAAPHRTILYVSVRMQQDPSASP